MPALLIHQGDLNRDVDDGMTVAHRRDRRYVGQHTIFIHPVACRNPLTCPSLLLIKATSRLGGRMNSNSVPLFIGVKLQDAHLRDLGRRVDRIKQFLR